MANWKHTIDISQAMESEDPRAVVQVLHDELEKIVGSDARSEYERQDVVQECKSTLAMEAIYDEDANDVLSAAYNWGDRGHECFINTMGI